MPPPPAPTTCWPAKADAWSRGSSWASPPAAVAVAGNRWAQGTMRRRLHNPHGTASAARQVLQRVHRLAVVADLEMQHLARGAGIAHLGDLLAGLDPGTLVHQPGTVVAVGRQPLLVVLDDHQLPVADQSGARVHHHAIGRGPHRLAALAGDVDALPG